MNESPQTFAAPRAEIGRFSGTVFSGQQSPRTALPPQIEQAIEDEPPIRGPITSLLGFGQQWFEGFPLGVIQIGRIQTIISHPAILATSPGQKLSNPNFKTCS